MNNLWLFKHFIIPYICNLDANSEYFSLHVNNAKISIRCIKGVTKVMYHNGTFVIYKN